MFGIPIIGFIPISCIGIPMFGDAIPGIAVCGVGCGASTFGGSYASTAGAGAGTGSAGAASSPPKNVPTISFAKSTGYNCKMVLSTKSPICIWKVIFTKVPFKNSAMPSLLMACSTLINLALGGLISIIFPNIWEREVAEEPIIWFIASHIALKCNSPNSPSVLVPSPPIIRSVIIFTSCSLRIKILLPSKPAV